MLRKQRNTLRLSAIRLNWESCLTSYGVNSHATNNQYKDYGNDETPTQPMVPLPAQSRQFTRLIQLEIRFIAKVFVAGTWRGGGGGGGGGGGVL